MLDSAKIDHVHELHNYGRQLGILKRMYKSYSLIIERAVKGPQALTIPNDHDETTNVPNDSSSEASTTTKPAPKIMYGVSLVPAAKVRFERLRDRINQLALSEIEACLNEKDDLMTLVRLEAIAHYSLLAH